MFEAAGQALGLIVGPLPLLALFGGSIIGILSGALPGGTVPTLVVLLGFAYGMDPAIALPLAIGMTATIPTGDTLPAVLLGVPGSYAGQATILDGHPLAQQGKAGVALAAAYFASLLGGVFGAVVLFATIPFARTVVNTFSSAEFFLLGLVAIAVVGVVSSGAVLKGLTAGAFGLLLALIGFDTITWTDRGTFGIDYLWEGIPIVPVVIGIYAIPEFMDMLIGDKPIARDALDDMMVSATRDRTEGIKAVLANKLLVLRTAGIGVFVGILPGIGAALSQWLAYAQARQTVPGGIETFGTGDIRGVIAPESANNAVDGGMLIPTLFFGIPGSVGMAIFLGFLILLGLTPGPSMLNENLHLTLLIAFSLVFANVIGTSVALLFTPQLAKIAFIRPTILVPIVLPILMLASFQSRFSFGDLYTMLAFGALGFFMKTYGWPRPPIIIAIVLGAIIEKFYFISSATYGWGMVTRVPFIIITLVAVGSGLYTLWMQRRTAVPSARTISVPQGAADDDVSAASEAVIGAVGLGTRAAVRVPRRPLRALLRPTPSGTFMLLLSVMFGYFLLQSLDWPLGAALLPRTITIFGLAALAISVIMHFARRDSGAKSQIMDIGRTSLDLPRDVVTRRTFKALGTTIALVLGIVAVGFKIAIPVYVFLFLIAFGRVRWWWAVLAAVAYIALLQGFFDYLLAIRWPDTLLDSLRGL